jgi:hypothetical protein
VDFFGTPWDDLTLEAVEGFLDGQQDEGLTWETKGTEIRREHVWKSVAGLANQIGGFLIVGARREADGWTVDGVAFDDEPPVWFSNHIRNGLRPVPDYDVAAFPVDNGKHVAVVAVSPVAEPPCLTSHAQLYERVSGATVAVTDPVAVARLMARGRFARERAESTALRAADRRRYGDGVPPFMHLILAMSGVGRAEDIASMLFRGSFEAAMAREIDRLPTHVFLMHDEDWVSRVYAFQDSISARRTSQPPSEQWDITARWDGSISVYYAGLIDIDRIWVLSEVLFPEVIRAMASAAGELLRELGGYGQTHVVLSMSGRDVDLRYEGRALPLREEETIIKRWTTESGIVSEPAMESVKREFLRSLGERVWEPG